MLEYEPQVAHHSGDNFLIVAFVRVKDCGGYHDVRPVVLVPSTDVAESRLRKLGHCLIELQREQLLDGLRSVLDQLKSLLYVLLLSTQGSHDLGIFSW